MTWKGKVLLLAILIIPSFIGFPFNLLAGHTVFGWTEELTVNGPTDGQVVYLVLALVGVLLICGIRTMSLGLTAGALVSLSLVFAGAFVAFVKAKTGWTDAPSAYQYSPYYMARFINIITVVPLALAVFLTIPFLQFERAILSSRGGVSIRQKVLLMIARVVNNIRYSVLPDIWSVLTEEKRKGEDGGKEFGAYVGEAVDGKDVKLRKRLKQVFVRSMYIAASGIAAAIEYVPLWAVEISRLPTRRSR